MGPENYAQFEFQKMQFIGSLGQLANNMRDCANFADQFAGIINTLTYNGNPPPFPTLPNGQYPMPVAPPILVQDESGKKRKSRGEDAEGKRKKKVKDPNAPKRPPSSYLLFQNDVRSELKAKNPGMPNNELLGAISKLWAEMPQEQKDAYEARNRDAKEVWLKKKAVYEGKGEVHAEPGAAAVAVPAKLPVAAPAPVEALAAASSPSTDTSSAVGEEVEDEGRDNTDDESSSEDQPPPKRSKKEEAKKDKKHKKTKISQ